MTIGHAPTERRIASATPADRRRQATWATAIGLAGVAVSAVIIALMHLFGPTAAISPIDLTVSEYGLTSSGWLFRLAVLILAGASISLFTAMVLSRRMPLRSPASVFAALWAAGLITLVLFPKADYAAVDSEGGDVHRIASFVAFVSLPIAVLLITRSAMGSRRWARWLAVASLAWFLPMIAAMVYQGLTGGAAWWTVIPLGLIERAMAGTELAALLVLGWPARRGPAPTSISDGSGDHLRHDPAPAPLDKKVST